MVLVYLTSQDEIQLSYILKMVLLLGDSVSQTGKFHKYPKQKERLSKLAWITIAARERHALKVIILRAQWELSGPLQHRIVGSECSPNISRRPRAVENTGTVFSWAFVKFSLFGHTISEGAPEQDQLQNVAHVGYLTKLVLGNHNFM